MTTAIILAAGRGSRFSKETKNKPKCLIKFDGHPLIAWQVAALREAGIKRIVAVTGYRGEMINDFVDDVIENTNWLTTNMVTSLLCAQKEITAPVIVSYSDIIYDETPIRLLLSDQSNLSITFDLDWMNLWSMRFEDPLRDAETFKINTNLQVTEIGLKTNNIDEIHGQYMGLLRITPEALKWMSKITSDSKEQNMFNERILNTKERNKIRNYTHIFIS